MLVLSRRIGERIVIKVNGMDIWIKLAQVGEGRAKLSVEAPQSVRVYREELYDKLEAQASAVNGPLPF